MIAEKIIKLLYLISKRLVDLALTINNNDSASIPYPAKLAVLHISLQRFACSILNDNLSSPPFINPSPPHLNSPYLNFLKAICVTIMELKRNFTNCFFVILWMGTFIISSCEAYKFNVGGKNGLWVVKPSENYNHWAERMRFQVNDTLCKQALALSLIYNSFSLYIINIIPCPVA